MDSPDRLDRLIAWFMVAINLDEPLEGPRLEGPKLDGGWVAPRA